MKRRSSPLTGTITVFEVPRPAARPMPRDVDPGRAQLVLDEVAEEVVAHLRHDCGPHAEPRERDRGVGGAAAGLDDEVLRRDQLARLGQALGGAARTRPRRRSRRRRPARADGTAALAIGDDGRAPDLGVGEDVELVAALRRELGDDRALGPGLEPVQRVGRDRVLVAGLEDDLVPDGVGAEVGARRTAAPGVGVGSPSV